MLSELVGVQVSVRGGSLSSFLTLLAFLGFLLLFVDVNLSKVIIIIHVHGWGIVILVKLQGSDGDKEECKSKHL